MKKPKRNIFIVLLSLFFLNANCQDIFIISKNDKVIEISIQDVEKITFQSKKIVVQNKLSTDIQCLLSEIKNINFSKERNTNINSINQNNIHKFYPNPISNFLYIESNFFIRNVELYSLSGYRYKKVDVLDYRCNLDLSNFDKGVYVLRIDDKSYKIIKN